MVSFEGGALQKLTSSGPKWPRIYLLLRADRLTESIYVRSYPD